MRTFKIPYNDITCCS